MASNAFRSGAPPGDEPSRLPLVGRRQELSFLVATLDDPPGRVEPVIMVTGEQGVGKSRLVDAACARAADGGWTVARGRAFPLEQGMPYALFGDAFLPLLRNLEPESLSVLSRGGRKELSYLFPALGTAGDGTPGGLPGDPEEFRTRILWNFAELLRNLASRSPLLVVLDDLHWADASSLQLLHFLARQRNGEPIVYLATYTDSERDRNTGLVRTERSLRSLHLCRALHLEPLSRKETLELVSRAFGVDEHVVREFSALLYGWTRGNPFFLEATLTGLVSSGRLRKRDGTWLGWELRELDLPRSVRDAVLAHLERLSDDARRVADLVAVVGKRAPWALLSSLADLSADALLEALSELCTAVVLEEAAEGAEVVYDFAHPLVRETLYKELGLARTRRLHGRIAEALESLYGGREIEHADQLATHFARADSLQAGEKAVRYLAVAGRAALARRADREAVGYLVAALDRLGDDPADGSPVDVPDLLADLARAHQHLGEFDEAVRRWDEARERLEPTDVESRAAMGRYRALARVWGGNVRGGLEDLDAAEDAAREGPAVGVLARIRLSRGILLQEMGRAGEARDQIRLVLGSAQEIGDAALLARAHRSMALVHIWLGPPETVRRHGARAIELADETGDAQVAFWSHWGLAVLEGLSGESDRMTGHVAEARRIADELRSPVLRLWTSEIAIEQAFATGDWESGIALGERAIALARSLNQRMLLPRLLVWTSSIYLGRGDLDRGRKLVDEAVDLAGLGRPTKSASIHAVVPAHIGLAHYHLTTGDYEEAVRVGEEGLAIAENTGYVLWALHRLLPVVAEAYLWLEDTRGAAAMAARMRTHAEPIGHRLGLAWAGACDAVIRWKEGDPEAGAVMMRRAAESLEEIPMVPAAARMRRQLAGRLAEIGDREGALRELRRVHDVFSRLGAQRELEKTRDQFREVGTRPPPRSDGRSGSPLTEREAEIARLVADGRSNKAVARELGISPRTVSTHLSNIYQKLDLGSRLGLARLVREGGLDDGRL